MEARKGNRVVVLIAGMLIQLCAGIIYMWSVFREPVAAHLNWDGSALTSSVMLAAFVIGIVAGGRAQDRFGPRKVLIPGSVLISAGMLLTALARPEFPELVYLTYGIISGFGVGAVYTTTVSVVQKWFPDKRGFATGMMVSAFGFSLVIFAPVTKALLSARGVPFTFAAIGLLFLLVCTACSFLIGNPPAASPAKGGPGAAPAKRQYTTREMLKTGQFYLIAFSMLFVLPAYFILNPQFVSLGVSRGLSEGSAVLTVMITGVANASGRLLFSWFSDLVGRRAAILTLTAITLAAVLALIFAEGVFFLVCVAAIAFAFGGSAGVYPALTADIYGTKHIGLNYGCVMVAFGISALVFPIVSGALAKTGDYTLSFILAGGTCVLTLILVPFIKKPARDG